MKNLEIPRNDNLCALCRVKEADETGSHMVPNVLTAVAFSFDGKAKRDREIVEKYHLNSSKDNSVYYGRDVSAEKITSDLGHEMTEEEQEDNVNTLCYDHIFCKDCEKRFCTLESAFGEYYKNEKSIHPKLAYLFWLSVFWRMSVGYMSIFMDAKDELNIRDILNKNLKSREEIVNSTEDLGDYGFVVFRLNEPLRKGDSGILGICKPQSPYIILVADYVVIMFANCSKMHRETPVLDWKIRLDDINTATKDEYIEWDLNIEEFHDFRKQIVETNYGVFNPEQEQCARKIRERERSEGKPMERKQFYQLMSLFKDNATLRVRQARRFQVAYVKMLEARSRGEEYDFLKDRDLMLNQEDVENYIEDLKAVRAHGESLMPFAFAREFLHDESLPSFEEIYEKMKLDMQNDPDSVLG